MNSIFKSCLAMLGLVASLSAGAQEATGDYATNYSTTDVSTRNSEDKPARQTTFFKLNSPKLGEQNVTWQETKPGLLYIDKSETNIVKAAPGETVTASVGYTYGWMHAYIYIDKDNDKQFSYTVDNTNHKADPNSDLVSFSFYNFGYQKNGSESDEQGYNSAGTLLTGGSRSTVTLPSFQAPAKPGKYRLRAKVDWCSIDPAGQKGDRFGGDMNSNGGGILDITLEVVDLTFNFKTADNSDAFTMYKLKDESDTSPQTTANALLGTSGFYTIQSVSPETFDANAETATIDVVISSTLPFVPSKMTAENTFEDNACKWYELHTKAQAPHPTRFVNVNESDVVRTLASSYTRDTSYMWTFVRVLGTTDRFKVYNFKKGAAAPLGLSSATASVAATFDATNSAKDFQFKKVTDGFTMSYPGAPTACLGRHSTVDGAANTGLGSWVDAGSPTDAGSTFTAVNVDDAVRAAIPQNDLETYATDQYVGTMLGERPAAFDTYLNAKTNDNLAAVTTELAKGINRVTTDPNKCYQIISYLDANTQGKTIYAKPWCDKNGGNSAFGDRELFLATNPTVAESAVKFLDDGKIQHANSKYYFVNLNAISDMANADLPVNSNSQFYVLENRRGYSNVWSLRCTANANKFLHSGGQAGEDVHVICRQDSPDTNDGCLWVIKEIREVPVTVGAAKWGTLCLPMAVSVPEDATLKVYKVSSVDTNGTLTLEEIVAGTVLAAETPVLLASSSENESDTYTFKVSYDDAGTALSDNLLSGTTARRAGFHPAEGTTTAYFGLANKNNTPGFYPATSDKIAANKAYMLAERVPSGASALNFDIHTTAIADAMLDETAPVEYYDLNGRRVLFPAHGIFVTNTGKKVFIQ